MNPDCANLIRAAGLLACATVFAQNAAPPTLRITVSLVQIDAVVTGKNGRHVDYLKKDDFQIFQDGQPRTITHFAYVPALKLAPQPASAPEMRRQGLIVPPSIAEARPERIRRTIALVVDDLGLSLPSIQYVREALHKFVDRELHPGDLVAILRTGGGSGALQQFTTDKRLLHAAIARVRWNGMGRGGLSALAPIEEPVRTIKIGSNGKPELTGTDLRGDLNTKLLRTRTFTNGTLGALSYIMLGLRDLPGRKSVILFSDGFKIHSTLGDLRDFKKEIPDLRSEVRRVTDFANRAAVVLYTIDARALQTTGLRADDDLSWARTPGEMVTALNVAAARSEEIVENWEGLAYLAEETGGLFYKDNNDLAGAARAAVEDLGGYYLLGYNPGEGAFTATGQESMYHRIQVKVTRPGLHVRSRAGYFGTPDQVGRPASQDATLQMAAAMASPFRSGDIDVRLTALFGHDSLNGAYVHSMLHISARDVTFVNAGNAARKAVVDVVTAAVGDQGQAAETSSRAFTIRVEPKAYKAVVRNGFMQEAIYPIKKPGAYQFRVVVRDESSGKIGSASQFVEVPDVRNGRLALSGIVMGKRSRASAAEGPKEPLADPHGGPALRIFRPGEPIFYGFAVYNAKVSPETHTHDVEIQVRVFREGEQVYAGQPSRVTAAASEDPRRLLVGQEVTLNARAQPGPYLLQVTATDKLAKAKEAPVVQWLDFELSPAQ